MNHPDMNHPDKNHPDMNHPDKNHPDMNHPDMNHPIMNHPNTNIPNMHQPSMDHPMNRKDGQVEDHPFNGKDVQVEAMSPIDEDEEVHMLQPATEGMKKYNVFYTTSRFNMSLHRGKQNTPATYYLHTNITLLKPQLELLYGTNKHEPMVAYGKFKKVGASRVVLVGTGDYRLAREEEPAYEELRREKNLLRHADYSFGTTAGSDTGKRAEFTWKREKRITKTIYSCTDEAGVVVADMSSGGLFNWRKGGVIEVRMGLREDLEAMLIVSALAILWYEMLWYRSLFRGYDGDDGSDENQEAGSQAVPGGSKGT